MTRVALKGLLGAQGPRRPDGARDRPRRRDGQRLVRPHRHDLEGVHSIFTSAYDKTDAVVSGKKLVDYSSSGNATVSGAVLARVRALPEVAAAAGAIVDLNGDSTQAKLIGRDGKTIDDAGAPTFGFGVDPSQPRFNPFNLDSGPLGAPAATRS